MQHFQNGEFSVLVPFVLKNLFDGDGLSGLGNGGFEDDSERAVSDDLLGVVGHALRVGEWNLGTYLLLLASSSVVYFVLL
jgi:hypothetical protein